MSSFESDSFLTVHSLNAIDPHLKCLSTKCRATSRPAASFTSNDHQPIGFSPTLAPSRSMHQETNHSSVEASTIGIPSRLCSVCGDISTGIHFGGNSCESCKAFFRRSVQCSRFQNYKCSNEEQCPVNVVTRKVCQYCRYTKCTATGMKPKWVLSDQEREEKYGARRKRFRETRAPEEDPDIYKYLTKEEKLLIEDIAHALYQSRATYPLQFPSQLNQYLSSLSSPADAAASPATPAEASSTAEKPPSPSANFLIVPIQRLVLFARMLKDFDLFSEDDKVNLLKGAAIEIMVCSSNTLFNPKTHTFTNYLSRDQQAVMDDQVMPLDPLLKKLWGENLFDRTRNFLISMCNLHVDEVTSTLLVPVILFSPDRSNINDLALVKRLQSKYVTLILKYMNWRYGNQQTENIYPKLLLQIVNIRTLSVAHAEVIQKVMATSSVNPLVQEITAQDPIPRNYQRASSTITDRMGEFSTPSTPRDNDSMDFDKAHSVDAQSYQGSDDEEVTRKKSRLAMDDDEDNEAEGSAGSNPKNIWAKRRKLSAFAETEWTKMKADSVEGAFKVQRHSMEQDLLSPSTTGLEKYPNPVYSHRRPHDHQVPNFGSTHQNESLTLHRSSFSRHLPPKKQGLAMARDASYEPLQRTQSSLSANELSAYYQNHSPSYSIPNSPMSPMSRQYYDDPRSEIHRQHLLRMPASVNSPQQKQNEHALHSLSIASNQSPKSSVQSPADPASNPATPLDADEQQLLDAIHAHPNKRDLVLNLLRQMTDCPVVSSIGHSK